MCSMHINDPSALTSLIDRVAKLTGLWDSDTTNAGLILNNIPIFRTIFAGFLKIFINFWTLGQFSKLK